MSRYRIVHDDGRRDRITSQVFSNYEAAYSELERYYADVCCSDDREIYRIEEEADAL